MNEVASPVSESSQSNNLFSKRSINTKQLLPPKEWLNRPLGDLVDPKYPICYGLVQVGKHVNNGIPIIAIKHLKRIGSAPLHQADFRLEENFARSRVKGDDVLISIKGTIGRIGLVPNNFEGNISRDLARIRVNEEVKAKYLAHLLEAEFTQDRIARSVVGTTRLEFSIGALREFDVSFPKSSAEQGTITDALSDADDLIESLISVIRKKKSIKQGVMDSLLSGAKRLPGFKKPWIDGIVADYIGCHFSGPSPTCEERNVENSLEWGVLKTTAVTWDNGWDWTSHKTLPSIYWGLSKIEIKHGDVIVTKAGPRHRVGVTAHVDFCPPHIVPSGKMIVLRPESKKALGIMLSSAIASRETQNYLDQRTTGMAESQVNFQNEALMTAPITLPDIDEQRAIAAIIKEMGSEIDVLNVRLIKARQIKLAMADALLTGKVQLT